MTITEMMVIGGGLLLGYWLVGVFLPTLFGKKSSEEPASEASEPPGQHKGRDRGYDSSDSDEAPHQQGASTPSPSPVRWFEVLEVNEGASDLQIAAAYKRKISQYHPDKVARMGIDIRRLAELKSKDINAAYDEAIRRS